MRGFLVLWSIGGAIWAQMWVAIDGYEKGAFLSVEHTCDGADIPIVVRWGGAPASARAYVVRMYDPDAPADTFTHWIVYNLSGGELNPRQGGYREGYNDFGRIGYGGPCPPSRDEAHRYVIEVYALHKPIQVGELATWDKIRLVLSDRVVARAETFVRYKRQRR
ncbi:MAG: YbhB/YbcL family Raf kinase inhibitor-like protein [Bacteroidia bacterium]|nr:YbhB/YbcL family Raf kinase inhibitor-like protein [Bacteroidia bacterium]